jgi:hypothetical protein
MQTSQDVSFSGFRNSIDSAPDTAVSAAPAGAEGSRNEPVPLTVTNGKTQESAGVPRTRRRGMAIWIAVGLGSLLLVGAKAMGFLGRPAPAEAPGIESAQTPAAAAAVAAPLVEPINPPPVALPDAKTERVEAAAPAGSAEAPAASARGLVPPRTAAAAPRQPSNWAAMPRPNATAKPAEAAASVTPVAKPAGQISNFGGRK